MASSLASRILKEGPKQIEQMKASSKPYYEDKRFIGFSMDEGSS